jgi:hypothetical protein
LASIHPEEEFLVKGIYFHQEAGGEEVFDSTFVALKFNYHPLTDQLNKIAIKAFFEDIPQVAAFFNQKLLPEIVRLWPEAGESLDMVPRIILDTAIRTTKKHFHRLIENFLVENLNRYPALIGLEIHEIQFNTQLSHYHLVFLSDLFLAGIGKVEALEIGQEQIIVKIIQFNNNASFVENRENIRIKGESFLRRFSLQITSLFDLKGKRDAGDRDDDQLTPRQESEQLIDYDGTKFKINQRG